MVLQGNICSIYINSRTQISFELFSTQVIEYTVNSYRPLLRYFLNIDLIKIQEIAKIQAINTIYIVSID